MIFFYIIVLISGTSLSSLCSATGNDIRSAMSTLQFAAVRTRNIASKNKIKAGTVQTGQCFFLSLLLPLSSFHYCNIFVTSSFFTLSLHYFFSFHSHSRSHFHSPLHFSYSIRNSWCNTVCVESWEHSFFYDQFRIEGWSKRRFPNLERGVIIL